MWPILLLLAVAQSSAEKGEQKIVGCSKHDQQMDSHQYSSKSLPKFNVTYGERVPAAVFNKISDVEDFIREINTYFDDVIVQHKVNDVDEFIRFYEQVKNVGTEDSFENFYKLGFQSITPFQDERYFKGDLPYYKFAPRLMSDLCNGSDTTFKNVKIKDSCYLVAVYKKSPREVKTKTSQTYYDLSHIAGAIRINVKGRPGVVLMDTGDNAFHPVVLMNDLKYPHMFSMDREPAQSTIVLFWRLFRKMPIIKIMTPRQLKERGAQKYYPRLKKLTFAGKTFSFEFNKNNKFVIVRNINEKDSETIYDIERPYCSFLRTSVSRYFYLKTTKSLVMRGRSVHILASISFDLTEKDPKKFKMSYYGFGKYQVQTIQFDKLKDMFNQIDKKVFDGIGDYYRDFRWALGDSQQLRKSLLAVVEIAENQKFVEKYKKYHTEMASLNQYEIQL